MLGNMSAIFTRTAIALGLLACVPQLVAQEIISPLHAIPRGNAPSMLKEGGLNEVFIYDNTGQTIPVIDDFSVDRTRHLNAQSSDANVTLTETIYQLEAGGISTAGMAFVNDTSYHITFDTQNDTLIVTQVRQSGDRCDRSRPFRLPRHRGEHVPMAALHGDGHGERRYYGHAGIGG
jgi:hypothetical protein